MHYCLPTVFSTSRFATLPLGDRTRFFVDTTHSYIVIKSARGIPILNTMARICSEVITHFLLNSRIRWKSRHSARSTRALVNFVKDILLVYTSSTPYPFERRKGSTRSCERPYKRNPHKIYKYWKPLSIRNPASRSIFH